MPVDLERFSLRTFLDSLPPAELERHARPVALADVAAALDGNPKAVLFEQVIGSDMTLCGNVTASRSRLAHALGTSVEDIARNVLARLRGPGTLVDLAQHEAPVQQCVLQGDECDLTRLPVHLQHGLDGAPYISASIDFSKDAKTGLCNVGVRRLMLRGRRTAGVDVIAPSDLRAIYQEHVARKERLPIAFVLGSNPIDHLAATLRLPGDELELMARLRAEPMGVVKCLTSDLRVPADAQMVIEGYLDEKGYAEKEGPYGEFLGCYGVVKKNPIFHVTAITHRRNAIFQTASIGGRTMAYTDTAQLCSLRTELMVWRSLELAVRDVRAVYMPPSTGGSFTARVAMQQHVPGEARNAIAAVFASSANIKQVTVVDPDIDIFSGDQMDWAMAIRFQADRDLVIQSNLRAMPLDPSLEGKTVTSKIGFDLTLPFSPPGKARPLEYLIPDPPTYDAPRFPSLKDALVDGPKSFADLMAAVGSRDGREIVLWLDDASKSEGIARDEDGRYFMRAAAGANAGKSSSTKE